MYLSSIVIGAVAVVGVAQAADHIVTVGKGGLLAFDPQNTVAAVGDTVTFQYFPKNHSVVQSTFGNPCHPSAPSFFSGFVATTQTPDATTFTITVNDTKPVWYYCGQTNNNHCQSGMVGSVNAPATGNTLDKFIALAKNATVPSTVPPTSPIGGVLSNGSGSSSSSSGANNAAAPPFSNSTNGIVTSTTTTSSSTSTSTSTSTNTASGSGFTGAASMVHGNVVGSAAGLVVAVLALF